VPIPPGILPRFPPRTALLQRLPTSLCALVALLTGLGLEPARAQDSSVGDGHAAAARAAAQPEGASPPGPPNVLFVVWDTTRADHTSLHGYEKDTTPFLKRWAQGGRVFDDCISTGSSTVPSHGAMFTGKLPSEHGANNGYNWLDDQHVTLAEIFRAAGYRTFCFAANPHISRRENFVQGFDAVVHPWDPAHREAALAILESKINPEDKSSELAAKILHRNPGIWDLKAAGELAGPSLVEWLDGGASGKPFFAFLNYMEAHRPFVPREVHRRRFMTEEQVEASYKADRSWPTMWSYTLGMYEYTPEELEVMALTYDACVYELDRLFEGLIGALEAKGYLENTVVVLTGDHGEQLGEHHMLDHQYSLYQGLVHVPMVLWYPKKVTPARVDLPVQNYDVFPTLLELAGLKPPEGLKSRAVSLLEPRPLRRRISEYPSVFSLGIDAVEGRYGERFDRARFDRTLRALYDRNFKLIAGSDGRNELFDLAADPQEQKNLAPARPDPVQAMLRELDRIVRSLAPFVPERRPQDLGAAAPDTAPRDPDLERILKATGYAGDDEEEPVQPDKAPQPPPQRKQAPSGGSVPPK
jgi:arylsulfatase A-like enzyme